jgi:soluble lytic murein transglycosylase-like protein
MSTGKWLDEVTILSCVLGRGRYGQPLRVRVRADWLKLIKEAPVVQTEWATRYEHGEGVAQDYGRAMQLYCAAARRGHVPAQYQLGWMFANGRGVARDDAQAAAWFRLAAAKGDAPAKQMLARVDDPAKIKRAACAEPVDPTRRPPACATRHPAGSARSPERARVEALVTRMAPNYGLQPSLVLAVIEAESGYNSQARSIKDAQGLMQLIPETAQRFGVQDPYDPVQNLHGGMAYLRWLLAYFRGDVRLTLAGYNAGEGAVLRYGGVPPYAETRLTSRRSLAHYGQLAHPAVAPVTRPGPLLQPPFLAGSAMASSRPLVELAGGNGRSVPPWSVVGGKLVLPNRVAPNGPDSIMPSTP